MKIKKTVYDDRKDATELADCIKMTVNSKMNLLRRLSVNDAIDFHVLLMHLRLKPTLVVILINFSFQVDRPKLKTAFFLIRLKIATRYIIMVSITDLQRLRNTSLCVRMIKTIKFKEER